uniref:Taste receptor type 2 n=1 Tax=Oryctolagus cuniculus TaxID=9986 RepID=A0A5F9CKD6_RABIT
MLTLTPELTVSYEGKITFMVLSVLEFAVGVLANAFIFWVSFWDVVEQQPVNSCDLVLLCLSTTRLLPHGLLFLDAVHLSFFQQTKDPLSHSYQIVIMLWTIRNQVSLWLPTCLSPLHCSKVARFSHTFLLCVASWISRRTPQLLLGGLLFCCIRTVLCVGDFRLNVHIGSVSLFYVFMFCSVGSIPLFLSFLVSSGVLIVSLRKHLRTMMAQASNVRDPSPEAHIQALKALVALICFYVVLFCTAVICCTDRVQCQAEEDRGHHSTLGSGPSEGKRPWDTVLRMDMTCMGLCLILHRYTSDSSLSLAISSVKYNRTSLHFMSMDSPTEE